MTYQVDVVGGFRADLGESPTWDAAHGCVWWVDAAAGALNRLDLASGSITTRGLGCRLAGLALAPEHVFVMAESRILAVPREAQPIGGADGDGVVQWHETSKALHDCGVAADGSIWVGTLSPQPDRMLGGMLRLDQGEVEGVRLLDGYGMPNGIAWTADGALTYIVDTARRVIFRSRFEGTEEVERAVWVGDLEDSGLPDGVAIDRDDGVWVAYWGTGCVVRYDRSGAVSRVIDVPARYATSCCFGGPDLAQLFITSARHGSTCEDGLDGALFVVDVEVPGLPVPLGVA